MERTEPYLNNMKNLRPPILVLQVKGEKKETFFFGYATRISGKGLFIQTTWPKDEKLRFNLKFSLTGDDEPIECVAEVSWRRLFDLTPTEDPGMGLKFLDLDENLAEKIDKWIESK